MVAFEIIISKSENKKMRENLEKMPVPSRVSSLGFLEFLEFQ